MDDPRIVGIEWGVFEGERPRSAGSNARLGVHGKTVRLPIMRVTTEDGSSGFGVCSVNPEQAESLLGKSLQEVFDNTSGVREPWQAFDYPLWDLMGQRAEKPVYALVSAMSGKNLETPFRVKCYDTTLYFDDLELPNVEAAAQLLAEEALEGYRAGHRSFKIKVGRGARHLPLEEGTARDIAIIKSVRKAVGPQAGLMIDANNGYNLNLTKHVLTETADCSIFWLEEAFHEDAVLYRDLHEWLKEQGISTFIADGEGAADPSLIAWAKEGLVDVIQYDVFGYGFTRWLALGQDLDHSGIRSAPHHYGRFYGNYVSGHLAGAIQNMLYVEWDAATMPGVDTSRYTLSEGWITLPEASGFGLTLDEPIFQKAVREAGYTLKL